MKLFIYILLCFPVHSYEVQNQSEPYPQVTDFLISESQPTDQFPQPSAPYFEDMEPAYTSSSLIPYSSAQFQISQTYSLTTHDIEKQLSQLQQENQQLKKQNQFMTEILRENNEMLRAIITTLQTQGLQMKDIESGQFRVEDQMINVMEKLKKWKTDMMQSNEHIITKILKWFKVGFRITASTTASITTYYTLAWMTAVLPAALTPPGWILLTSSLSVGALYYITTTV